MFRVGLKCFPTHYKCLAALATAQHHSVRNCSHNNNNNNNNENGTEEDSGEADFLFDTLSAASPKVNSPPKMKKNETPSEGFAWTALGSTSSEGQNREQSRRLTELFVEKKETLRVREAPGTAFTGERKVAVRRPAASAFQLDEDEDGEAVTSLATVPPPTSEMEILEQELLDDSFNYFSEQEGPVVDPITPYTPGQQIVPPGLTRYRLEVQYQGSDFDGWYKSSHRRVGGTAVEDGMTVRHHAKTILEEALAVAFDIVTCNVVAAVIPETGVSVRRLTCHVDIPSDVEMQPRTILQRATLWLQKRGQPLAVLACHPCKNQDFHARHSGVRRVYCYRILNRVAPPLFDAGLQWHVDRHLDVARMQRFAAAMEGTRDFGYFCDPKMLHALRRTARSNPGRNSAAALPEAHNPLNPTTAPKEDYERGLTNLDRAAALPTFNRYGQTVKSFDAKPKQFLKAKTNLPTVRTVDTIRVTRQEDEVLLWFVGQSFLRHQIRSMVAVLKAAGNGLWDEQELQHALQSGLETSQKRYERERLPPAPVHGLTLWDVEYPRQFAPDYVPYVDSGPLEGIRLSRDN
ncbi:tRNA pseudouridine synthase, putative [Angomonas deanei]|uniref:tRNA pseudouridine synthase, putative n=1 Tax=Angomonas deanei TaxID=59799 RepID=A0A7G2CCN8_9TRYP|nr:tRNA pseudouridine synthase, putative [Angomonas deanei]